MRRVLAVAVVVVVLWASGLAARDLPIGFRVLERRDMARHSKGSPQGRPLQIAIWYPRSGAGTPMTFSDYVALAASETSPATPAAVAKTLEGYRAFLARAGATAAEIDAWLATKMNAARDAPSGGVTPPLVLIAQGNGDSAADQAFLAERLAAHGLVVATAPSQANLDGPMKSESDVTAHVEAQTADLEYVLRTLSEERIGRTEDYGVLGHSFGARSALLLAMREPRITAVASLDGGIGSKTGRRELESATGFDRSRMHARLLHLYEIGDPAMTVDLDLVRSLPAEKWIGRVDAMRHVHFSTAGVLAARIPSVARATSADSRTFDAWQAVADAACGFFEHHLPAAKATKGTRGTNWAAPASPFIHWESTGRSEKP